MPGDRLPWFKCWPDDILLSPRVAQMDPAQFGSYMKILLHAYRSETGRISNEEADLLFYVGKGADLAVIESVLPMFKLVDDRHLTHEHVEAGLRFASNSASREERNRENGRKGGVQSGKSRREKKKEAKASSNYEAKNEARSPEQNRTDQSRADASAPPEGARSRVSTPQSEPLTSPAGSAPAARAGGAAPARPASAPVQFNPHWPPAPGYLGTQGWRIDPLTGVVVQPPGWQSQPVGDEHAASRPAPVVPPPAPAQPAGDPKAEERARRAATVRAQAAAVLANSSPEERAAVEARLAEQDAAAAPVPLPVAAEGGDA